AAKVGRRPRLEPQKTPTRRRGFRLPAPALVGLGLVDLDEERLLGPDGKRHAPRPFAHGARDLDERGADVARSPPVVEVGHVEAGAARAALVGIALSLPRRHGSSAAW